MHSYWCSPPLGEGGWPLPQPRTYTCLPVPLLLPPIQAHNFCSRPSSLGAGEWTAPREYHYFYGSTAAAVPPWWFFPSAYAAALPPPPAGVLGPSLQTEPEATESWAPWPEGSSLQVELRWGRVERALGRRLQLPDFVRRELRRVYGTYPRTDARVTYRRGEFLLQGLPRVLEPEYHVERRVVRRPDSGGSGDGAPEGEAQELRRRRSKKKGLN
ncbi:uncharacterized protein C10orf95 homolog [Ochotona curzoniae]|uniref:uncharacterized protein C10orf95 homolog n=1 Tax=Ochotona curzoniae TaxID=130825 RepID=UPI001B34B9D9|nr:uncharacterized protein C10orf95 homolog [Ochotona curzoniae]